MRYNSKIQSSRSKYLKGKPLSESEQQIIGKDFQRRDYELFKFASKCSFQFAEKYAADSTFRIIEKRIGKLSGWRRKRLYYAASAAAVLLILFAGTFLYTTTGRSDLLVVATSYGETKTVQLPDGSLVTLNSLSSVSYPSQPDDNIREVRLKGEAFFDVTKDPHKVFVVKTDQLEVKVLGTKFNMKAYENESFVTTSLFEGAVSVDVYNGGISKLRPGEQAVYSKAKTSIDIIHPNHLESEVTWIDGVWTFDNKPLQTILRTLEREKNISFKLTDPNLIKFRVTASFTHNEALEDILDVLSQSAEFSFCRQGNTYTIEPLK